MLQLSTSLLYTLSPALLCEINIMMPSLFAYLQFQIQLSFTEGLIYVRNFAGLFLDLT